MFYSLFKYEKYAAEAYFVLRERVMRQPQIFVDGKCLSFDVGVKILFASGVEFCKCGIARVSDHSTIT